MRQTIKFEKNMKEGLLTVIESSEVDPGVVTPLQEETYSLEEISAASKEGFEAFVKKFRKRSFFPTSEMCRKIFDETVDFFKSDEMETIAVEYDDIDSIPDEEEFVLEDDDVEIDKILEEDGTSDEDEIKEIDAKDDNIKFTPEDTSEHEN